MQVLLDAGIRPMPRGDKLGSCAIKGGLSLQIRAHFMRYLDFWTRSTISSSRTWLLVIALPLVDGKGLLMSCQQDRLLS